MLSHENKVFRVLYELYSNVILCIQKCVKIFLRKMSLKRFMKKTKIKLHNFEAIFFSFSKFW